MADRTRNIFISHRQEDEGHIDPMKDGLRGRGLNVRDSSVYSGKNSNRAKNEDYIRHLLRRRIRWAGCLVVIVSKRTRLHDWVNWEIDYAHKTGTRIVGVWAEGHDECPVPASLKKYADAMVSWEWHDIRDAILGDINGWRLPSGETRPICALPDIIC